MVTEVTIAGGGPAGSALAIALGRRGVPVVLYEKAHAPRFKPCGEGLLPHGVAALRELTGLPDAPRLRGLKFVAGDESVDVDFPEGHGLVVRRDRFDAWLLQRAAETPLVDVRLGTAYRASTSRFVVGADGRHSMFHRRLPARAARRQRVGLSAHVEGLDGLTNQVEIYFHAGGELYMAPTGGGEALVSALFDYQAFRRDGITTLLRQTPALRDRLSRLVFTSPVLAAAPLALHVPHIVEETSGLLLVGDAAGSPDPIAAGGLALAMEGTAAAADAIVSGRLADYQQRRQAMGRSAARLGELMLSLGRSERRASWVLQHLSALIPRLLASAMTRHA